MASSRVLTLTLLMLLAGQLAVQPFISKAHTAPAATKTSLVAACELCKIVLAFLGLLASGASGEVLADWNLRGSLSAAGAPALIYSVQNVCLQHAYENLSPTAFQLVNQTKIFWAAFFSWLLVGQKASRVQKMSLLLLVSAAFLATHPERRAAKATRFWSGVLPGLLAAALSGLASTLSLRAMQVRGRNTFLFGGEMAVYSLAALAVGAAIFPSPNLSGWTLGTLVPVVTNAMGGLLVGLVTARAGNVAKGYAIVAGILATGLMEGIFVRSRVPWTLWAALLLMVGSTLLRVQGLRLAALGSISPSDDGRPSG